MNRTGRKRRKEHRSRATAYEALKGKLLRYQNTQGAEREIIRNEINILVGKLQLQIQRN